MKNSMEYVERSEIIYWITDFCKSRPKSIMIDDETNSLETDVKKFVSNKIAYLEKSGWLVSERTNDFKIVYQFEAAAIAILNAMEGVEKSQSRPIEHTGYIYNIHSQLMNFDINQGTITIEQMVEASRKLNENLRSINNSIKKYLNSLLENENISAGELLRILLEDYQKNVVANAFYNLRVVDNPSKYRGDINDKIEELLKECVGRLIDNYVNVKFNGDRSGDHQNEAQEFIVRSLTEIKEQFENIDKTINVLERQNTKYVSTATARLKYLINEESDVEGRVYDILKKICEKNLSYDTEFEFSLKNYSRLDESSISNYTKRKAKIVSKKLPQRPIVNPADSVREKEKLQQQAKFSILNINKFICSHLVDKQNIEAKDIVLRDYDDLIILFLAQIYAGSEHVQYDVKLKDEFFSYKKSKMTNYVIYRR